MIKNLTRKWVTAVGMVTVAAIIMGMFAFATPVFASSNYTNTSTLPYTSDYIQTRTWVGNYHAQLCCYPDTDLFDAVSSSWLWGTNPENAYLIQDSDKITVNGLSASLSNTGGSVDPTSSEATYTCDSKNNWYCGNNMYNLLAGGWVIWSKTGTDTTQVIIWENTQPYWNQASTTNYW